MTFQQRLARLIRRLPGVLQFFYYIYRFFQPRYTAGVIAVILNESGEVLLVEHVFHPHFPWGLPGGWIGRNEDPQRAIEREIMEELQLTVQVEEILLCRRTQNSHLDMAFFCRAQNDIGELSYELLQYRWYSPDDLPPIYSFHYEAILKAQAQHPAANPPETNPSRTQSSETAHDAG